MFLCVHNITEFCNNKQEKIHFSVFICMNDITQRFLELYDYLLSLGEVDGKADFATKVGISTSSFTEISKGRNNVGLSAVQKTVTIFDWINVSWLLKGDGTIDKRTVKSDSTPMTTNENGGDSPDNLTTFAPPTNTNIAPPTAPPTNKLWLPKVVIVNENERELISLVPVKASAGYLNGYADPEYVETLPTIRLPNLGAGTHRAFEIKGSSMNPTFHNKSIVIGRWLESFDDIVDRRIYIIVTNEYGIVAKRVLNRISERGVLTLVSDNSNKNDYGNYDVEPEDIKEMWYVRANLSFEFPEPDNSLLSRMDDMEAHLAIILKQLNDKK